MMNACAAPVSMPAAGVAAAVAAGVGTAAFAFARILAAAG